MFSNLCDAPEEDAKADNENGEAQNNNVDPKGGSQPDQVARSPMVTCGTIILPPFRTPTTPPCAAFYHLLLTLAMVL